MTSAELTIALGYRELNAVPKVLYVGNDCDAARSAINAAGDKGNIVEGRIIRNFDSSVLYRHRFETPATAR
jgi:hypothetical protein